MSTSLFYISLSFTLPGRDKKWVALKYLSANVFDMIRRSVCVYYVWLCECECVCVCVCDDDKISLVSGLDRCSHCMWLKATFTFYLSLLWWVFKPPFRCCMFCSYYIYIITNETFPSISGSCRIWEKQSHRNAYNSTTVVECLLFRWICGEHTYENIKPRKSQKLWFLLLFFIPRSRSISLFVDVMFKSRANKLKWECARARATSLSGLSFRRIKRKTMSFVEWKRIQAECFFGGFCGSTQYIHHIVCSLSFIRSQNLSL